MGSLAIQGASEGGEFEVAPGSAPPPVVGPELRLVGLPAYGTAPGTAGSDLLRRVRYGRAGPAVEDLLAVRNAPRNPFLRAMGLGS